MPGCIKKSFGVLAWKRKIFRHFSKYFHHLSKVIIIFIKSWSFSRLKQEIACYHFKDHTSEWPNICWGPIVNSNNCLRRPILPGLNFTWKMMMIPASISQITNLYLDVFINFRTSFEFLCINSWLLRFLCNLIYNGSKCLWFEEFKFLPFFQSFFICFS